MKVACISDLHGHLPEIEECSLLIIAGDICPHIPGKVVEKNGRKRWEPPTGGNRDIAYQLKWLNGPCREWLNDVPAKSIVATPGNHDFVWERARLMVPTDLRWHLLMDEVAVVEGKKVFGSPWQHFFRNWAFNAPKGPEGEEFLSRKWLFIPDNVDIIVIHGPPYGYGDAAPCDKDTGEIEWELTGSKSLTETILRIKPQLSVHGHIHMGRGSWRFARGNCQDGIVVNAAICDERNKPTYFPMYFNID